MSYLLSFFIVFPLIALFVSLSLPRAWEKGIAFTAITGISVNLMLYIALLYLWSIEGFHPIAQQGLILFSNVHYTFALDFYFDVVSAVYYGVTCIMTLMIMLFSKTYMHRDQGYKRFYNTVLVFFTGLTLVILSGNLETLFLGWEFIGISSFLLIAFYRDRFLPAKNSLKVFSIYRVADAVFLGALWYAHHIFEKNIHFSEFTELIAAHGNSLTTLGVLFLIVAIIKSAQFPFSYWLPRAMEGPTTSSAIFYGALAVHMGLFVLLRTFPLWEGDMILRGCIVVFGVASALIASSITRVQSSIKTQIAYASITQIGIMFVELALGLHWLVLIHFISNALLRTYQLLISPSIVGYMIHEQFFYFILPVQKIGDNFLGRIRATLYVLGIKEWNMDIYFASYIWKPFKTVGRAIKMLDKPAAMIVAAVVLLIGGYVLYSEQFSPTVLLTVATLAAFVSLLYYVRAFTTKEHPRTAWNNVFFGHLFGILFLTVFLERSYMELFMYLSGIIVAFVLGHLCLIYLDKKGEHDELIEYHGHMYEHGRLGIFFFLVCLAYMAFPITPSFLGQEILLSHIGTEHVLQMILFSMGYIFAGISVMRLYAKVFFGPHDKTYHEIAYRSS
ncbi:MAG: proton-conducting transporter membrane subunit [Candidatus Gracilibacteria bacterium]